MIKRIISASTLFYSTDEIERARRATGISAVGVSIIIPFCSHHSQNHLSSTGYMKVMKCRQKCRLTLNILKQINYYFSFEQNSHPGRKSFNLSPGIFQLTVPEPDLPGPGLIIRNRQPVGNGLF
jgi:hypothetical protein